MRSIRYHFKSNSFLYSKVGFNLFLIDGAKNTLESTKLKIRGIAILDNSIYIVRQTSRLIESYDMETLRKKERTIEVKLLDSPWGMAVCTECKCLYVSEHENRNAALIHKIILSVNKPKPTFFTVSEKFFAAPVNISTTGKQTVLVSGGKPFDPVIMEYDQHGTHLREIAFHKRNDVHKNVLLTEDVMLLALGLLGDVDLQMISKINLVNGEILSSYSHKDGSEMGMGYDLIVNADGTKVFVAIADKKCVLGLDLGLKILDSGLDSGLKKFGNRAVNGTPFRLAINKQKLYVAYWTGGLTTVDISR